MNIDKNNISAPKQLIGGERREKGLLQIWTQSTDTVKQYSTNLNGTYDLTLVDIKMISAGAVGSGFCVQVNSDTLRIDRGNLNDAFKFFFRTGAAEIPNPIIFRQVEIRNWIDLTFSQLGGVGTNFTTSNYNILLTFEYEKL